MEGRSSGVPVVTLVAWLDSYNKRKTEPDWIVRKNKVLKCLKDGEISKTQIMQETKLKGTSVLWMLNDLKQAKIIKSRLVDGNELYAINDPLPPDAIL